MNRARLIAIVIAPREMPTRPIFCRLRSFKQLKMKNGSPNTNCQDVLANALWIDFSITYARDQCRN